MRLKQIMEVVVRHLHEIAREVDLRPSELFAAMQFLTEVGQKGTPQWQEFMILSAVLGLKRLSDGRYYLRRSDEYIDSDTAFGVTESLILNIVDHDPQSPFPDMPALNFDITLRSARLMTQL